ncbi:MAG: hypothetical protein WCO26_14985 [Deltaproteobacteria bacterium]
MSQHFVKQGEPSPGISSFTRIRLGWITRPHVHFVRPGETSYTFLSPLSKKGETLAVKIPLEDGTYYLIENRQPIGSDRVLPDAGILVLKVDPEAQEGYGTVKIMNADPKAPGFARATFRLDRDGRTLFMDKRNKIAVIPLWEESENLGVLMVPPKKSGDALQAALLIQRMLHRKGRGSAGKFDKDVNNAIAAFKRFDFAGSARMAREE